MEDQAVPIEIADELGLCIVYALEDRTMHNIDEVQESGHMKTHDDRPMASIRGDFDMREAGAELARLLLKMGWRTPAATENIASLMAENERLRAALRAASHPR